ncbi:MAG TPA: T9SS type A sorting domain-containing protein, partial [Bacteroidia bacterium]|nr:T9SS type A sorting domain-containing protein [Bacteroidia bacterium]
NNSFIDGPIIKKTTATTAYVLPIGKISPNNEYRPLKLTPAGTTTTTYIAEYFYGQPTNNTDVGTGVNHVSELETWTVQRSSGTEDAKIELSWNANSVVSDNTTDLLVVQDAGTTGPRWVNRCSCNTTGTTASGTIETTTYMSLFGTSYPFTLASPHATNNELGNSRYSVANGNWNSTSTWAIRSGGPSGASVPTNTKRVIIEAGNRVDIDVNANALKLTLGNNGSGILDFNATTNDVIVGSEGVIINFGSDVEGTNTAAVLRTSGDLAINADLSIESADNVTASNYTVMRETTASKLWSGTGTVPNFTNNASTILIGSATVKTALGGSAQIINAGSIKLNGPAASITANMIDNTTLTPNTMEFNNTVANFDFTAKATTFYNLILTGASTKRPSVAWTVNGSLTLNAGLTLDQNTNDNDIIVKGDWINNGATFTPSTTSTCEVTLSGSSEQRVTSGGSAFGNLIINNSSSTGIVLQDAMQIDNGRLLTLSDGYLFLGNNNITLLTTNVNPASASSGSFIVTDGTGKLRIEAITGSRTFPVGSSGNTTDYTPVIIDNTGGTSDRYDVSVCNNVYQDGNCSGGTIISTKSIDKTWNISENVAGGSSVDLTLQWNAAQELSSFDRTTSFISHYTGGKWVQQQASGNASGSGPYTRTVTNLTGSFSPFAVGSFNSPLPIELLNFHANLVNSSVVLDWATASETNNDYFLIERSGDGSVFETIAQLDGAGNSIQKLNYVTTDASPLTGISYYRIRQVDFDGNYTLSPIRNINYSAIGAALNPVAFSVYPNPTKSSAQLFFPNINPNQTFNIAVYDISGKLIYSVVTTLNETVSIVGLPDNLTPGAYFIQCSSEGNRHIEKLIILAEN